MFFDLNIPLPAPALLANYANQNKQKQSGEPPCLYSASQIATLEMRIDLLIHLGYTVLALSQICQSKVDGKTHIDHISGLIPKLKKRPGVQLLKRLTIVLDEASEKGNGINTQNAAIFSPYDILSVRPFTSATFSAACLTHSVPSQTTTHIISIPISHSSRLPYYLRHTLIRTAISNGAVFEVDYAGAVASDESERKFWWGGLREVVRVTRGISLLLSGGTETDREARAPRDAANLITLSGLPQNLSCNAISQTAKTVVLRAHSRKTYRSILSEPTLIMPSVASHSTVTPSIAVSTTGKSTQEPGFSEKEAAKAPSTVAPTPEQTNGGQGNQIKSTLLSSNGLQKETSNTMDRPQSQSSQRENPKQQPQLQPLPHPQPRFSKEERTDNDKDHPTVNIGTDVSIAVSTGTSRGGTVNTKKRPRADSDQPPKQKPVASRISSVGFDGQAKKKKKKH